MFSYMTLGESNFVQGIVYEAKMKEGESKYDNDDEASSVWFR